MTDDIDNDGTTLHESGGVVQPTDAQIDAIDLPALGDHDTERGWLRAYAHAVLALAVPQAPLQAEPVPVVASEPTVSLSYGVPHTCAGLVGAYIGEHGREPTRQEIWNGAIRSFQDLATPQAEPAVAEQARDFAETVNLMLGAVGYTSEYARQWPTEKASVTFKRWFDEQISQASQSTPPSPLLGYEQTIDKAKACGARVTQHEIGFTHAEFAQFIASTPPPESAGTVRFDIPAEDCFVWDGAPKYPMVTCMDCKATDYGISRLEHKPGCRVNIILAANRTAQPDGGSKA